MESNQLTSPIILDDIDKVDGELLEFTENYARDIAISTEALERARASVLASVARQLQKLNPVTISDEMRELGLEEQIFSMIQVAESMYKINQFFNDDEDDDSIGGSDLWSFLH